MRLPFCVLHFVFCISLLGCSPAAPDIAVKPTSGKGLLDQHFTRAYYALDDSGSDRVVLVDDPIDQKLPGKPGGPLPSIPVANVRQVFIARIQWRAGSGTAPGSIAATNAVLHWYVYGGPGPGTGMIHYEGRGFVRILGSGPAARVEIEEGSLKLVEKVGDLVDPLQSFAVSGTFQALENTEQVEAVQCNVDAAEEAAQASSPASNPSTMPAAAATMQSTSPSQP